MRKRNIFNNLNYKKKNFRFQKEKSYLIIIASSFDKVKRSLLLAGNIDASIKVNSPEEHDKIFTMPASVLAKAS